MEPSEHEETQETPQEYTEPMADKVQTEIIDLAEPEPPAEPPPAPDLAEPGVYVCIHENVQEHTVLGVLTFGEEYDYTTTQDERTLAAVAACVESGYLEKV